MFLILTSSKIQSIKNFILFHNYIIKRTNLQKQYLFIYFKENTYSRITLELCSRTCVQIASCGGATQEERNLYFRYNGWYNLCRVWILGQLLGPLWETIFQHTLCTRGNGGVFNPTNNESSLGSCELVQSFRRLRDTNKPTYIVNSVIDCRFSVLLVIHQFYF